MNDKLSAKARNCNQPQRTFNYFGKLVPENSNSLTPQPMLSVCVSVVCINACSRNVTFCDSLKESALAVCLIVASELSIHLADGQVVATILNI